MRRAVLHPSAFVDWFAPDPPELRAQFEAGRIQILVPRAFVADALELLAARGWQGERLTKAAEAMGRIGFSLTDAPAAELATWIGRGLPASVARYAALASWQDLPIAVADPAIRERLRTLPQAHL